MSKVEGKKLGDILNLKRGYDLPSYEREDGLYPIFSSSGISGYHSQYKADGEGVVIGRYGTLGEPYYVNGKYWPHNTSLYVTDFKGNSPKYVYYLLKCLGDIKTSDKSTVPGVNRNELHEMSVPFVTTRKQQDKIAAVLSVLDAKIELNNRINAELESLAKTIYDYWFVQFDFPFDFAQGKPSADGKPYKSSGGEMVYVQEGKGERAIPAGWEVKKLREFANTASGGTPLSTKSEYYEKGDIAWINSGEVNNRYITEANNFITHAGLDNSSAKLFEPNTLLVAMYGATAGKVSLLQIHACTNQAICAITPNSIIYNNFLKFALDDLYKHLINLSTGSARDNLSQDIIKNLKFTLPEENLLIRFNKVVNPIISKILVNQRENQQLTQLRDWLLPMLMNGQVSIK
jgi:type I restriction enzyme S subunit